MADEIQWVLKRDSDDLYSRGRKPKTKWTEWTDDPDKAQKYHTLLIACEVLVEFAHWCGEHSLAAPIDVFPVQIRRVERWEEVMNDGIKWVLKRDSDDRYCRRPYDFCSAAWTSDLGSASSFPSLGSARETLVEYAYALGTEGKVGPPLDVFPVRVRKVVRWEEVTPGG